MVWILGVMEWVLPLPCLIWAWISWFKAKPRIALPAWRSWVAFAGVLTVSLQLLVTAACWSLYKDLAGSQYEILLLWAKTLMVLSVVAIALAIVGTGKTRLPVALSAVGFVALSILTVILR